MDATSEALYDFKTHYTGTRGIPELVTAVRRYLERRYHYSAKESELMSMPGGRFGVYMALATTVKEGEGIVVIEPNWPAYKEVLQFIGRSRKGGSPRWRRYTTPSGPTPGRSC